MPNAAETVEAQYTAAERLTFLPQPARTLVAIMTDQVHRSENALLVFISSRMNDDLKCAREIAVEAVGSVEFGRPVCVRSLIPP